MLRFCRECGQMTNHKGKVCLKCKAAKGEAGAAKMSPNVDTKSIRCEGLGANTGMRQSSASSSQEPRKR